MEYKIEWLETKNEDWKVASLTDGSGKGLKDVSINRKSKKGDVFPEFDTLLPGANVSGELWQSGGGKWYLFPPKVETSFPRANRGQLGAITAAQNVKREDIATAQKNKEGSIKVSSTFRAAYETSIAEWQDLRRTSISTCPPLDELFLKWREFYWVRYDEDGHNFKPF